MLHRLGCQVGEGIYCDSTSIRKGYKGDVTHSAVADQCKFPGQLLSALALITIFFMCSKNAADSNSFSRPIIYYSTRGL